MTGFGKEGEARRRAEAQRRQLLDREKWDWLIEANQRSGETKIE